MNISGGFTKFHNKIIRDNSISWAAKGLLAYLLSCHEDFNITQETIVNFARDGIDSVKTIIRELKRSGYLTIKRERSQSGKFEYKYEINPFNEPITKKKDEVKSRVILTSVSTNPKENQTVTRYIEAWNRVAKVNGFKQVEYDREFSVLIDKFEAKGGDIESFVKAIKGVSELSFFRGENNSNWKLNFLFFLNIDKLKKFNNGDYFENKPVDKKTKCDSNIEKLSNFVRTSRYLNEVFQIEKFKNELDNHIVDNLDDYDKEYIEEVVTNFGRDSLPDFLMKKGWYIDFARKFAFENKELINEVLCY